MKGNTKMRYMEFYKLYDWILCEMGASADAVLIAFIFSFEENNKECSCSYSQFAALLRIERRNAIEKINRLAAAGYITITKNSTRRNIYKVNRSAFTSDASVTSASDASVTSATQTSDASVTSASDASVTSLVMPASLDTIKRENKREIKRESAHTPEQLAIIPGYPAIRISESELEKFQKLDLTKTGKTHEYYYASLEHELSKGKDYPNHFTALRKWAMHDGATEKSMSNSSIDPADLDRLMMQAR